jgi:hypothetical protein
VVVVGKQEKLICSPYFVSVAIYGWKKKDGRSKVRGRGRGPEGY